METANRERIGSPVSPPISLAVEHLSGVIDGMAQVIDRFSQKLQPVLGPVYPDPPTESNNESREVSDLAATLENQALALERLMYVGNRLIDRIEL
jgi:hypothetical protein